MIENWGSTYADLAAAAAAAALSAFVVPGLFDAELKLPKRLLSLGAAAAGLGRGAVDVVALPLGPALVGALETCAGLLASLGFEVTTIFFVAGWMVFSPSRARLEPAISDTESPGGPLPVESSLLDFAFACFLFVDADALSMIF